MATVNLAATPRAGAGKGVARKLRAAERIPAILYGYQTDPIALSVDALELRRALSTRSGSRVVLRMELEGTSEPKVALIKEIQRHPVSRQITHVDLLAIDLNETVDVAVPILAQGMPIGVRLEGGVLSWGRREVQIRVLPTAIPEQIELDISDLHVNQALHVRDVSAEDFEILDDEGLTICSVASSKLEIIEEEEVVEGEVVEGEAVEGEAASEAEGEEPSTD